MSENLQFTPAAAARVAWLANKRGNPALKLRLSVDGGGCSGFQYKFDLADTPDADDTVIETNGVQLLVDQVSLPFLDGCAVDYVESLAGSAFQVRNPNATSSCGCGTSFSV
jgi:iron-sulfur cluster insertion protein